MATPASKASGKRSPRASARVVARRERAAVEKIVRKTAKQFASVVRGLPPSQTAEWVRIGLPVRSVGEFAKSVGLTKDDMYSLIHLSRSTAHRMEQKDQLMDPLHSDAFAGASAVIQKAREMLASEEAVRKWLSTPIGALDFKAPMEWLDTSQGRQIVSSLLDQIQSGAYA